MVVLTYRRLLYGSSWWQLKLEVWWLSALPTCLTTTKIHLRETFHLHSRRCYAASKMCCGCIIFHFISCSCGCRNRSSACCIMDFFLCHCWMSVQNGNSERKLSLFDSEELTPITGIYPVLESYISAFKFHHSCWKYVDVPPGRAVI